MARFTKQEPLNSHQIYIDRLKKQGFHPHSTADNSKEFQAKLAVVDENVLPSLGDGKPRSCPWNQLFGNGYWSKSNACAVEQENDNGTENVTSVGLRRS